MEEAEAKLQSYQDFQNAGPATDASAAKSYVTPANPAPLPPLRSGNERKGNRIRCTFCGIANHTEEVCRKKTAAISALRQKLQTGSGSNPSKGTNGQIRHSKMAANGSATGPPAEPTVALSPNPCALNPSPNLQSPTSHYIIVIARRATPPPSPMLF